MALDLLQKLADKSVTKEQLTKKIIQNPALITEMLCGFSSPTPAIRYGCGKILMDVSEHHPELLYPYMDVFIDLLNSKYRILTWNALITIANLTTVDTEKKFDAAFKKYYELLQDDYMVTVANVVGSSGKIAVAKPHLTNQIVEKLLAVENLSTTPHLTTECKRVIIEHAITSFDLFFPQIEQKTTVIAFVNKHRNSSRKSLRIASEKFLKKWGVPP